MSAMLRVELLNVRFGDRHVLNDASLSLAAGEVAAIIGPNGSGKSTLLRAALGLIPSKGTIAWEGRELSQWNRRLLARRVAYLPQSPVHEAGQSVRDVLRLGRSPYWSAFGLESEKDDVAVEAIFSRLGLDDRPMESLSGGQRQRVYIGRCLVQQPTVLVLDEPDTFLDLRHAVTLHDDLQTLAREQQLAVLVTSHDLNSAAAFADRLVLMHEGRMVADGPADEVMRPERMSPVFGVELERIDRAGRSPILVPVRN